MAKAAEVLQADRSESSLLVLFIPSHDRYGQPFGPEVQESWLTEALRILGESFGGATAFPQGRGVWRDDARGGSLVFDSPVVIQCYTNEESLEREAQKLREFLTRLGTELMQGAVGLVIDRDYLELRFPLP